VDLHLGYLTPWNVDFDGSIANLLNSNTYHETVGQHSNTISSFVYSGRTYHLSAKYAF
jgi:outer membrane receptor for ferrienterochelin and colicin